MQDAWQNFGFEKSPFLHSYDWVQIDDTRLDVLFVCIYPKVWGGGPACLSSDQTMQNTSGTTDMCSSLTLGSFGESLLSRNTGKLVVTTNQTLLTFFKHRTNAYVLNSVKINRLSISAAFNDTSRLVSLQTSDPRKSIFDESITPLIASRSFFCASIQNAWCPQDTFSFSGGKRCPTGWGFANRGNICLHYDSNQGTKRRPAAVTYCNAIQNSQLTYPANEDEVNFVSCMVGGSSNVRALGQRTSNACSNPRNGNNNLNAYHPQIPYVSLWAGGQPSGCSENSLQIRRDGKWNDEDDTNDSNRAICQQSQICRNCNRNGCPRCMFIRWARQLNLIVMQYPPTPGPGRNT